MRVCYFGMYDPDYPRHRVLMRGLEENGHELLECNSRLSGFAKYKELYKKHKKIRGQYDVMLVAFPGQTIVPFAKLITSKKIIFDAFSSHYEGYVVDRGYHAKISPMAIYYWCLDWLSTMLSDVVLFDTQAHINYFSRLLKLQPSLFKRVFVGSDETVFYPRAKQEQNKFVVYFHGTYIPLQGTDVIIKAAKLLDKDIEFQLLGKGQTYKQTNNFARKLKVENVKFLDPVPYKDLADKMNQADIVLGIFGKTEKAGRVIPNKVFEGLALKKPVITQESPAINELLTDRKNVLLCKPGNPQDLADKIMELKNNDELRNQIAENGYQLFEDKLSPKELVKDLI